MRTKAEIGPMIIGFVVLIAIAFAMAYYDGQL
jgi:hypothetical protein